MPGAGDGGLFSHVDHRRRRNKGDRFDPERVQQPQHSSAAAPAPLRRSHHLSTHDPRHMSPRNGLAEILVPIACLSKSAFNYSLIRRHILID